MRVSVIFNVWGGDALRMDITRKCLENAFNTCGYGDYEVLACDNGSNNAELQRLVRSMPFLAHFRINDENQGNYQMLNQSLLRATGDIFCVIDPDILLPKNWLTTLVDLNQAIPQSGVVGIHTVSGKGETRTEAGVKIDVRNPAAVFGTKLWNRKLLDKIGYFCEDYGLYGLGDSDFSLRARHAGFLNYYVHDLHARHLGHDVNQKNEFRLAKNQSLKDKRRDSFVGNSDRYAEGDYYIGPPEMS